MPRNIYDEAILIQNAVNGTGVKHSMTEWLDNTDVSHNHPAIRLMDAQLFSLTGKGMFRGEYMPTDEWKECMDKAEALSVEYKMEGSGYSATKHDAEFRRMVWDMLTAWDKYISESSEKNKNEYNQRRAAVAYNWATWMESDNIDPVQIGDDWDVYAKPSLNGMPEIIIITRDVLPSHWDGVKYFYACYGQQEDDAPRPLPYVSIYHEDQGYNDPERTNPCVPDTWCPPFRTHAAALAAAETYAKNNGWNGSYYYEG